MEKIVYPQVGVGMSWSEKQELMELMLNKKDMIIITDPKNEYDEFIKTLRENK